MVKRSQINANRNFYRHRHDHRRRRRRQQHIAYTFWSKTIFRTLFKSHHTPNAARQITISFPFRFTCKLLFTCYQLPFITSIRKSSYYYQIYVHTYVKSTYFSLLDGWAKQQKKKHEIFVPLKHFPPKHTIHPFVWMNTRTYFHGLLASFSTLSNSIDKTIFNTMKSNHTTQERVCFFLFISHSGIFV